MLKCQNVQNKIYLIVYRKKGVLILKSEVNISIKYTLCSKKRIWKYGA